MRQSLVLAAILATVVTTPALAQQDYCNRRFGNQVMMDEGATRTFREMVARQDNNAIVAMTGVWYAEIAAPEQRMTSYQYRQFDSNGLFQYRDQTCTTGTSFCSQNQGTGFFAAITAQDGSLQTFLIVSDLHRDHECVGGYARFLDQNTMQDGAGAVWRRVQ
jgi:hypothetical protein